MPIITKERQANNGKPFFLLSFLFYITRTPHKAENPHKTHETIKASKLIKSHTNEPTNPKKLSERANATPKTQTPMHQKQKAPTTTGCFSFYG